VAQRWEHGSECGGVHGVEIRRGNATIVKYGIEEDTSDSMEVCAVRRRSLHIHVVSVEGGKPSRADYGQCALLTSRTCPPHSRSLGHCGQPPASYQATQSMHGDSRYTREVAQISSPKPHCALSGTRGSPSTGNFSSNTLYSHMTSYRLICSWLSYIHGVLRE
jgi:hypothetical protein